MSPTFDDLTTKLTDTQAHVSDREVKKASETAAHVQLDDSTQQLKQAHEETEASRRQVEADRRELHALVDAVTAEDQEPVARPMQDPAAPTPA